MARFTELKMTLCGYEFIVASFVLLGVECNDDHGQFAIGKSGEQLVCLPKSEVEKAVVIRLASCPKSNQEQLRDEWPDIAEGSQS